MTEHIPRDFIDQLLNRVDIVDYIDSRVTLRKKTGSNFLLAVLFIMKKVLLFLSAKQSSFIIVLGVARMAMRLIS